MTGTPTNRPNNTSSGSKPLPNHFHSEIQQAFQTEFTDTSLSFCLFLCFIKSQYYFKLFLEHEALVKA